MISLSSEKPEIPKRVLKSLRKTKWEHQVEVVEWAENANIEVRSFESWETPHLRFGMVDYWPATRRFYDFSLRLWGHGFDQLKEHLLTKFPWRS